MLSIIVSSYNQNNFCQFEESVSKTIGEIPYEIVKIDNPGIMGICEAYNLGVSRAKYEYLCFSHDDVAMVTPGWGNKLVEIFKTNPSVGIVGIAGSSYRSLAPSGWYAKDSKRFEYINLLQDYRYQSHPPEHKVNNPKNERLAKVICVDGVWFCTKKSVVNEFPFDEITFKKYHCYDLDFSLSVHHKYEAVVTFDILLRHFSEGNYWSKEWAEETLALFYKWKHKMPICVEAIGKKEQRAIELGALRQFSFCLRLLDFRLLAILRFISSVELFRFVPFGELIRLYSVILYAWFKKTVKAQMSFKKPLHA
ncbi:MAG: hypothetical protein EOO46_08480 [Flavobacterium sp.]|nr:MAG: hypothetical protein EOO46_08480 [Flavobacterium sp.]